MKKRGGKRDGAGRPCRGDEPASERVVFRITPEERDALLELADDGESHHQAARGIIEGALMMARLRKQHS